MPHTNFPKETQVIFVEVDPVVLHAASITSSSWMLPVLAHTALAMAHVAPKFTGLPQSGWHVRGPDQFPVYFLAPLRLLLF